MKRTIGAVVLGLSACGYPLTQVVIRRWGVRGAAVAESVCAGLVIRDASMVAGGVTGKLRRIPVILLWLELAAGIVASLAGLIPLLSARSARRDGIGGEKATAENVRRVSVATLFTLHTIRFGIYLRPGQGRREAAAAVASPQSGLTSRRGRRGGAVQPARVVRACYQA